MRVSILTVSAALLTLSSAQLNLLPTCAQTCVAGFTAAGGLIGSCQALDIHCICSSGGFLSGIACCLAANCGQADINSAISFAKNICLTADPPVTVPNQVVCPSTGTTAATASQTAATASSTTLIASSSLTASGTAGSVTAATTATTAKAATTTAPPASSVQSSSTTAAAASTASKAAAGSNKVAGAGMGIAGGLAAALVLL